MDKIISNTSGAAASRASYRNNTDRKNTMAKSTYAQILSGIIAKQTEELQEAIKSGQTMQQKALGISNEEWARMDLQSSSLTKTDAEKEREEKNAQSNTLPGGDIEITKHIMGDGSTLIVKTRGGRIISQCRKKPRMIAVANPSYIPPEKGGQPSGANRKTKLVPHWSPFD
ncbi:MAG: hypothetical protein ACI3U2_08850 [Anaerovibrio sp.]